jgi:hypothetical protein
MTPTQPSVSPDVLRYLPLSLRPRSRMAQGGMRLAVLCPPSAPVFVSALAGSHLLVLVAFCLIGLALVILVVGTLYGRAATTRRRARGLEAKLTAIETLLTGGVVGLLAMIAGGWALAQGSARDKLAGVLLVAGGGIFGALSLLALRASRGRP